MSVPYAIDHLSLRLENHQLFLLNQQKIPLEEEWVLVTSPEKMVDCIKGLQVRGAPLIGLSAAWSLALYAQANPDTSHKDLLDKLEMLNASRPTAVNLMNNMAVMRRAITEYRSDETDYSLRELLVQKATDLWEEDVAMSEAMACHGSELISDGDHIVTICNTGSLACAGGGTALGVIKKAWEQGKKIHVTALETRPLLQGGRLTTWELEKAGIPYTLITDSMQGYLMKHKPVNKIFVGADRITTGGDAANKIGTYTLAVSAAFHGVPFYVVAPRTTIDRDLSEGKDIEIEMRRPEEVRGFWIKTEQTADDTSSQDFLWAPEKAPCLNPSFDVTPSALIEGFVLDSGVHKPCELNSA